MPDFVLLIASFAAFWSLLLYLLAHVSGWRRPATRYRAPMDASALVLRHHVVAMGGAMQRGAGSTVVLGISASGLYLTSRLAFRPWHPPIRIPWQEVTLPRLNKIFAKPTYDLELARMATLYVTAEGFEAIRPYLSPHTLLPSQQ